MRTVIVTLMWGDAFDRYGWKFATSAQMLWPRDWQLIVVTDREMERARFPAATIFVELRTADHAAFFARWRDDDAARGIGEGGDYRWRHDACKWFPQALAPRLALPYLLDGECMVWLDADVETLAPPPADFFAEQLAGADVAYLGRAGTHPEIGYWSALVGPSTRAMIRGFADLYLTGDVFALAEQHSAFVWAEQLRRFVMAKLLHATDLTPGGRGHVWFESPLADHFDHMKGKRKDRGGSRESQALRAKGGWYGRLETKTD